MKEEMQKIMEMSENDEPTPEQLSALADLLNENMKPSPEEMKTEKVPTKEEMENLRKISREKLAADKAKEPYVTIVGMDVDYNDLDGGSFDWDWNGEFIKRLLKAGYKGKEDEDIVDQWFTQVCRNVAMEVHENEMADPDKRRNFTQKLDDNRREHR